MRCSRNCQVIFMEWFICHQHCVTAACHWTHSRGGWRLICLDSHERHPAPLWRLVILALDINVMTYLLTYRAACHSRQWDHKRETVVSITCAHLWDDKRVSIGKLVAASIGRWHPVLCQVQWYDSRLWIQHNTNRFLLQHEEDEEHSTTQS